MILSGAITSLAHKGRIGDESSIKSARLVDENASSNVSHRVVQLTVQGAQPDAVSFQPERAFGDAFDRVHRLHYIVNGYVRRIVQQAEAAVFPALRLHQTRAAQRLQDLEQIIDRHLGLSRDLLRSRRRSPPHGEKNHGPQRVFGSRGEHPTP